MLCLADVSNQPTKPSCLQKLSRKEGLERLPSLGSSHWGEKRVSRTGGRRELVAARGEES